jgi:hypothetical protein
MGRTTANAAKKKQYPSSAIDTSALRVGHAFSDFSDHSLRLRFRSVPWATHNDLGPFADEHARIAGISRDTLQSRERRKAACEGD